MVRKLLWPLFKRFKGLFFSMCFSGMLALGLLIAFTNSYLNLTLTYPKYFDEYGSPTVLVDTDYRDASAELADIRGLDGVEAAEARLSFDCHLRRQDEREVTSRLFTYSVESPLNKLYVKESLSAEELSAMRSQYESIQNPEDILNFESVMWVSIDATFARNNSIKLGDTVQIGLLDTYLPVKVGKLILSPETIYIRVQDYIWSDSIDFGFVYIEKEATAAFLSTLANQVDKRMKEDVLFKLKVELMMKSFGEHFPSVEELKEYETAKDLVNRYGNQMSVLSTKPTEEAKKQVTDYYDSKGIGIKDVHTRDTLVSYNYITEASRQLQVAAIFIPVFFYGITMFVIILFIQQMIRSMTSDIGVMMSVGVSGRQITGVLSLFVFIMSLVSTALGLGFAAALMNVVQSNFIRVYHIPYMITGVNPIMLLGGLLSLILIGQIAVLIASRTIYRITPKDAMISNESKRKPLPKAVQKLIDKSPSTIRLGLNSILQNFRRFFVSVFSIFAALTMSLSVTMFVDAKNELMHQTLDLRLTYDCQVYMASKLSDETLAELKGASYIKTLPSGKKAIGNGYFTYLEISNGDKKLQRQTVALDIDTPEDLLFIPDISGKRDIEIDPEGIILDKRTAEELRVSIGDNVQIQGIYVPVANISNQYFNMTEYVSSSTLTRLGADAGSTLYINTSDENALLSFLAAHEEQSITIFSKALRQDLTERLSAINLFSYVLVPFSMAMGLLILSIMTQNALLEQKRALSVMRAVGFRTIDVSNVWMIQSFLQLLISNLFAVPTAIFTSRFLFGLASSSRQVYPFVFNPASLTVVFFFVLAVIGFAHLFAMISISRWNLADNTRSRE
ncbi:MAG: ABC transporter permease [Bacilli bacterium]|nr:ABC transporter permease [Bacilli bacterium]